MHTPGSTNSLFSDFFGEFWRGILGGVRERFWEVSGGKIKETRGEHSDNYRGKDSEKSRYSY